MATPAQGPQGAPLNPQKKTSPLIWILGAVLGLIFLLGTAVIIGGYFIAKKVGDVASNPGMAAARLMVAANPDLDLVSTDDAKGTVTVREKTTGKVYTLRLEDVKNGRLTVEHEGKSTSLEAGAGGLEARSSDGATATIGGAAKLPSWVPAYPGATPSGIAASDTAQEESGSVSFSTADTVDKVLAFYADALKRGGMQNIESNSMVIPGTSNKTGAVSGESPDGKRSISAAVTSADGKTGVILGYNAKK